MEAPQDKSNTPRQEKSVQDCTPSAAPGSVYRECLLHRVRLILEEVPLDVNAPGRMVECYRCPVTRQVVR